MRSSARQFNAAMIISALATAGCARPVPQQASASEPPDVITAMDMHTSDGEDLSRQATEDMAPPAGSLDMTPETPDAGARVTYLDAPLHEPDCSGFVFKPKRKKSKEPDQLRDRFSPAHEPYWFSATRAAPTTRSPLPVGSWTRDESAWVLPIARAESADRDALIMPSTLTTSARLTRVRLHTEGPLEMTIWTSSMDKAGKQPEGVGVRLTETEAQLVSSDGATIQTLSPPRTVYQLAKRQDVELVILQDPRRAIAIFHDAETGVELASLSARLTSPRPQSGVTVTLPAAHTNMESTKLTHASQRALCARPLPARVARPTRLFVTLPHSALPALTTTLSAELTLVEERSTANVYETDLSGVEALHCAGVEVESASANIPFKYIGADYMKYRALPPVRDPGGGFRTDLSFKNHQMTNALLRAFHEEYPALTRLEKIGVSNQGREILAMAIGENLDEPAGRPSILLNAAHHGDEPTSTEIVFDAIQYLLANPSEDERVAQWLSSFIIYAVPQVNPDGAQTFLEHSRRAGRKNGRHQPARPSDDLSSGVDLNRNYPFQWGALGEEGSSSELDSSYYRGAEAGSEPETKAMMGLATRELFSASISYHTGTVCILAPYTIDKVKQPVPNDAWAFGKHMSRVMPEHPEGRPFRLRKNLYAVDGTDQDWLRAEHGTIALLVEAVRHTPKSYCARREVVLSNRRSWIELLQRVSDGPTLVGVVRDAEGAPVEATITLAEQSLNAGEVWKTRPSDGLFTRFPSKPGALTVQISAPGYLNETRSVRVKRGVLTHIEVTLSRVPDDPAH